MLSGASRPQDSNELASLNLPQFNPVAVVVWLKCFTVTHSHYTYSCSSGITWISNGKAKFISLFIFWTVFYTVTLL